MVRRSASIALRIAAIAFGVLVVVAGFFAWRIFSGGPVSLSLLNSRLEAMINSGLKGVQLSIGDSVIEWSKDNKLAHLQFIDVEAVDGTGNVIARVPRANVIGAINQGWEIAITVLMPITTPSSLRTKASAKCSGEFS